MDHSRAAAHRGFQIGWTRSATARERPLAPVREAAPVIRALGDQPERLTIIDNTAEAALAAVKGFNA